MRQAHYEVRRAGSHVASAHTGGALTADFNWACDKAREQSWADDDSTPRMEVRFRGMSETAADLLVAAFSRGEQIDIRTQAARGEQESR